MATIQPIKLNPSEKAIVKNILDQERSQTRLLHSQTSNRVTKNALSFYHTDVVKALNKLEGYEAWNKELK
jgi:hypothetical protein